MNQRLRNNCYSTYFDKKHLFLRILTKNFFSKYDNVSFCDWNDCMFNRRNIFGGIQQFFLIRGPKCFLAQGSRQHLAYSGLESNLCWGFSSQRFRILQAVIAAATCGLVAKAYRKSFFCFCKQNFAHLL